MSLLTKISITEKIFPPPVKNLLPQKTEPVAVISATPAIPFTPCPTCATSTHYWQSIYDETIHCETCLPPPTQTMVQKKFTAVEQPDGKKYLQEDQTATEPAKANTLADDAVGGQEGNGGLQLLTVHYSPAELRSLESGRWAPKHAEAWANGRCRGMFSLYFDGLAKAGMSK